MVLTLDLGAEEEVGMPAKPARWAVGAAKLPYPHLPAELGSAPASLVLQAGHGGEVGTPDEHVAGMGRVGNLWEGSCSEDSELPTRARLEVRSQVRGSATNCGLVRQGVRWSEPLAKHKVAGSTPVTRSHWPRSVVRSRHRRD